MEPTGASRSRSTIDDANLGALGRWAASLIAVLGSEVLGELGRFSRIPGPGATLTIRRTRDGFTAQVTGAIVGGRVEPLTPDSIRSIVVEVNGEDQLLDPEVSSWQGR